MRVPANAASTAPTIKLSPRRVSIRGLALENNRSRITAFRDDVVGRFRDNVVEKSRDDAAGRFRNNAAGNFVMT